MTDHNPGYTLERLPFKGALPPEQEKNARMRDWPAAVSYTHLRAHET